MGEIEPCPSCGALPCDWTETPPRTRPDDLLARALKLLEKLPYPHKSEDGLSNVLVGLQVQDLREARRIVSEAKGG